MKRKIIKQGHNTLTVTLPSDWARRFNVGAGREVDLCERENGLFISTEKSGETKKAEFDITGMDIPTIWKYFMAVYREGYDEVLVKFNPDAEIESPYKFYTSHRIDLRYKKERAKKTMTEALNGFVNRFIGFEVVEHGKDFILIKEMGEITSKEFDNSLRRVFLIIQQMAEETLEALETSDTGMLSHTHDVDINLDKFHDYCIRVMNKSCNKEVRKTSLLFSTLFLLELMGDEFKNISSHIIRDFPQAKFKNTLPLAKLTKDQFDCYYSLFYNFSKEGISKLSDIDKQVYFNVPFAYKKASEDEKEIFHHLRMISRYINSLTELRIEMEF